MVQKYRFLAIQPGRLKAMKWLKKSKNKVFGGNIHLKESLMEGLDEQY